MDTIVAINDAINGFVWGAPAIIMIIAVGLFLTFKLKGIQFRNLGFMIKKTYVEAFTKKEETNNRGEGQITSFQAAMAAVSAVVGSGNTAGVATALVIGGPGALFWTLVAAAVGAATKYAEIFLGVKYREKDSKGNFVSGPMYYVTKATGWKWLAKIMGLLIMFYSIIISAVVDTNTMALAVEEAVGIKPIISGIIFAILTAVVIMGGITRIGEVCGILAPFMAGGYLLCGILIIILNIGQLPAAISQIVVGAFNPQSAPCSSPCATVWRAVSSRMKPVPVLRPSPTALPRSAILRSRPSGARWRSSWIPASSARFPLSPSSFPVSGTAAMTASFC